MKRDFEVLLATVARKMEKGWKLLPEKVAWGLIVEHVHDLGMFFVFFGAGSNELQKKCHTGTPFWSDCNKTFINNEVFYRQLKQLVKLG